MLWAAGVQDQLHCTKQHAPRILAAVFLLTMQLATLELLSPMLLHPLVLLAWPSLPSTSEHVETTQNLSTLQNN